MQRIAYTSNQALNERIHAARIRRAAAGLQVDGICFATADQRDDYLMRKEANRLWNLWQDGQLSSNRADHE